MTILECVRDLVAKRRARARPSIQTSERSERSACYLGAQPIHQQWESDYLNQYIEPLYEAVFDRLASGLGAEPDSTILDAGCGYGLHAMRLARRGLRVTAVDSSSSALQEAQNKAWFDLVRQAAYAMGNVLIFEKEVSMS